MNDIPTILVLGSKYLTSRYQVKEALSELYLPYFPKKITLLSGGRGRVHEYVQDFAEENCLEYDCCQPKQIKKVILNNLVDECVVFWDDESKMLYDSAVVCKKKYISTRIINVSH